MSNFWLLSIMLIIAVLAYKIYQSNEKHRKEYNKIRLANRLALVDIYDAKMKIEQQQFELELKLSKEEMRIAIERLGVEIYFFQNSKSNK